MIGGCATVCSMWHSATSNPIHTEKWDQNSAPKSNTSSCLQQSASPNYIIEASSLLASDAVLVVSYRRSEEHYCFILRGQELQKQTSWVAWPLNMKELGSAEASVSIYWWAWPISEEYGFNLERNEFGSSTCVTDRRTDGRTYKTQVTEEAIDWRHGAWQRDLLWCCNQAMPFLHDCIICSSATNGRRTKPT